MPALPNYHSLSTLAAIKVYGNLVSTLIMLLLAAYLGRRALGQYTCCKGLVHKTANGPVDASKGHPAPTRRVIDTNAILGLRFIAAVNVMVGHFLELFSRGDAMSGWAVSFFFIVSGYVMTIANLDRCQEHGFDALFVAKRIARLLPMNCVSLLMTIPTLAQQGVLLERLPALPLNIVMIQSWGINDYSIWNPASWTLSAFLFFYIAFGPLARSLKSRQDHGKLSWSSWCLPGFSSMAFPTVTYFALSLGLMNSTQGWPGSVRELANLDIYMSARSNPLMRLPTFYIGMVFGALVLRNKSGMYSGDNTDLESNASEHNAAQIHSPSKPCVPDILSVTVIGLWSLMMWVSLPSGPLGVWGEQHHFGIRLGFEVGLIPLFALWIYALTDATESYSYKLLSVWPIKYGGEISFSVYLLHVPVMSLGTCLIPPPWPAWMLIPCVLATFLVAGVCYRWVEKPLREPLSRWLAPAVTVDSHTTEGVDQYKPNDHVQLSAAQAVKT